VSSGKNLRVSKIKDRERRNQMNKKAFAFLSLLIITASKAINNFIERKKYETDCIAFNGDWNSDIKRSRSREGIERRYFPG
jgi:hypothetical protein